jgi:hypothetical protein
VVAILFFFIPRQNGLCKGIAHFMNFCYVCGLFIASVSIDGKIVSQ